MQLLREYIPPFYQSNGHLQTIIPSVFRKVPRLRYLHERISTPDDDYLDLYWLLAKENRSKTLCILSHGLEGDSMRPYMQGMAKTLSQNGYDTLSWNFRGCGSELNRQLIFYHSGATYDLQTVVEYAQMQGYEQIALLGFSLGGNLSLKYLGEGNAAGAIKAAVVFSVPMHLESCSLKIMEPQNFLYHRRFLKSLKEKILQKSKLYPNELKPHVLGKIQSLYDFDDTFTSKLHGFIDAKDYYTKNSSIIFVEKIAVPTLIVNAANDPFLAKDCYPTELLSNHAKVQLEIPAGGGHCGFWQRGYAGTLWSEMRALQFLQQVL